MSSPSTPSTASVAGVWKRLCEEDPIGDTTNADRDTTVWWTQAATSGMYVDLRLPKDSPGLSLEAATRLGIPPRPSALAGGVERYDVLLPYMDVLLRQKSFAGVLDVQAGDRTDGQALRQDKVLQKLANDPAAVIPLCVCFWRRDLDYQPPTGGLDVGVCASAAAVDTQGNLLLRETGDDASYAEDWSRSSVTAKGPFMALQLVDDNRSGYWVRAADCFAYAVGRPTTTSAEDGNDGPLAAASRVDKCVGKSLAEAVRALASTDADRMDIITSYIGVAGRINAQGQWVIHHSLNPELVGCTLLVGPNSQPEMLCSSLEKQGDDTTQVVQIIPLPNGKQVKRTWKIVELSDGCSLPLSMA